GAGGATGGAGAAAATGGGATGAGATAAPGCGARSTSAAVPIPAIKISAGGSTVRSAGAIRKGCANVGPSDGVGTSSKASAGGGGGRLEGAIPRAGVGRKALIGSLGVRNPGCGVGGVCAIAPAETPSAPGGTEP